MERRLLILLSASQQGGAENEVLEFLKKYDKSRFSLTVITIKKGNIDEIFEKQCKLNNIDYRCLNSEKKFSLSTLYKLVSIIYNNKIDLVHANLIQSEIYASLSKLFKWDLEIVSSKLAFNSFKYSFSYKVIAKLMSYTNKKIILISESLLEFYHCTINIPKNKLKVVYCGVDPKYFNNTYSEKKISDLKKKNKIGQDDFTIGIVGRLVKIKNHITLFRAINILKSKIPFIKLLVVGTGELEISLKDYVKKNNLSKHVIFMGFKRDLIDVYSVMDIFCLPSFKEGFGKVIVEARGCDAFVIASNTTAMKELINNKTDGFLFDPKSENELANTIYWVYKNQDKAKIMARKGKLLAENKFDMSKIVSEKEDIFCN